LASLKSLKKGVGSGVGSRAGSGVGSGSISQRYGSGDPDPHPNVTDPQNCFKSRGPPRDVVPIGLGISAPYMSDRKRKVQNAGVGVLSLPVYPVL
jgi:hypothetical protein